MGADLDRILVTADVYGKGGHGGGDLLLVGVLRGAVMVMADLARKIAIPVEMDWMAVSSYGSGTKSSGVVRILKDLDTDIAGRDVLIVEDVIDSGLTLSWLKANLESRCPASAASPPAWRPGPPPAIAHPSPRTTAGRHPAARANRADPRHPAAKADRAGPGRCPAAKTDPARANPARAGLRVSPASGTTGSPGCGSGSPG